MYKGFLFSSDLVVRIHIGRLVRAHVKQITVVYDRDGYCDVVEA